MRVCAIDISNFPAPRNDEIKQAYSLNLLQLFLSQCIDTSTCSWTLESRCSSTSLPTRVLGTMLMRSDHAPLPLQLDWLHLQTTA